VNDSRIKKAEDPARESRELQDRAVTENREMSDAERLRLFRENFAQAVLPDIPEIPGFHVCWLTTNNPRDSIQNRIRQGYVPIRPTDLPGWEIAEFTTKTASYGDIIGINEMLAFKIPEHLYQMYMKEVHHDAPHREERKLVDTADRIREQARRQKSDVEEDTGIVTIRAENDEKATQIPTFS